MEGKIVVAENKEGTGLFYSGEGNDGVENERGCRCVAVTAAVRMIAAFEASSRMPSLSPIPEAAMMSDNLDERRNPPAMVSRQEKRNLKRREGMTFTAKAAPTRGVRIQAISLFRRVGKSNLIPTTMKKSGMKKPKPMASSLMECPLIGRAIEEGKKSAGQKSSQNHLGSDEFRENDEGHQESNSAVDFRLRCDGSDLAAKRFIPVFLIRINPIL